MSLSKCPTNTKGCDGEKKKSKFKDLFEGFECFKGYFQRHDKVAAMEVGKAPKEVADGGNNIVKRIKVAKDRSVYCKNLYIVMYGAIIFCLAVFIAITYYIVLRAA